MPAVSTKRQVLPPSSMSSSTGSRVVPATLSTTTRSEPARRLSRLDLPTLGRPTRATRRGPPWAYAPCADTSGSTSSTASRASPLPRPCTADTGNGWPRPRFHSIAASASPRWSSTLLATSTTGLPERRSSLTTASSSSVAPTVASTTNMTTSARSIAISACAAPQDAVDQARLADVGSADHGHDGQRALPRAVVGDRPLGVEQRLVLGAELEVVEPGAQGALHGGVVDGGVGGRDRSALVDGAGGLVSHGVLESVNVC